MEPRSSWRTTSSGRWCIDRARGLASELLVSAWPEASPGSSDVVGIDDGLLRRLRWCEVVAPAVVIGSSQPASDVDPARAAGTGTPVVRRRSGGGAVLVGPSQVLWGDVEIEARDTLWDPDIARTAWWLGETWVAALAHLGVSGATAHREKSVATPWSKKICFAGTGPGEVLVGGGKCVGISQRRTRTTCRLQFAVLLRWDPGALLGLLRLEDTVRAAASEELAPAARAVEADVEALIGAFENNLP